MASTRTRRSVTGLDIEPSYIAAAQVRSNGRLEVESAATAPLDPGIMRDGEVTDVDALAEALKTFFADHNLGKRVRLGVANQRIVVRTLDLPRLDDPKELDAAVRFQAQEHIPMTLDLAVLDYQTLGVVQTPDGEEHHFFVGGGALEVQPTKVTVLADTALRARDIDEAAALAAKQRAEEALRDKAGHITQAEALAELARAAAQLKLVARLRKLRG